MRKTMIICDHCGKEIKTDPIKLHAVAVSRESDNCMEGTCPWPRLAEKDYHYACAGKLISGFLNKPAEDEADQESPPHPQREIQKDRPGQSNGIVQGWPERQVDCRRNAVLRQGYILHFIETEGGKRRCSYISC